uniref:Uncharacterized protein n=1 Tax=Trichogramma kaykai TaxID=54128 RepID=A0ABD2WWW9_9HYME
MSSSSSSASESDDHDQTDGQVDFFVYLYRFCIVNDFLIELKSISETVNWEIEEEKHTLFNRVQFLIRNWEGPLPNLRDIFRIEEIDWLLTEDVKNKNDTIYGGYKFVRFVVKTGYKDEPKINEVGKPLLRRTTAVHHASRHCFLTDALPNLFKIYNRFDVNYTDESGLSHFHAACKFGLKNIVEKFLELGQDPNCVVDETGDAPLHLALEMGNTNVVKMLLRNDADPNLANAQALTPLHIICQRDDDDENLVDMLFELGNHKYQPVRVDAGDKLGRTPLQLAVANFLPNLFNVLLDRGADLSSFVFPTEGYFGETFSREDSHFDDITLLLASDTLIIVERLEKRGYELNRASALTIIKYFSKRRMFEISTDLDTKLYDDEEFIIETKKWMMNSSLSLYDVVRLQPKKAEKSFTYTDYYQFMHQDYFEIAEEPRLACATHMREIIMRRFCRRWALDSFLELTGYQLPILCCEIIFEKLMNKDLCSIFMAVADQSS